MAAVLAQGARNSNGLRPLEPSTDLRGVAALIEEAFAQDLDHMGRAALRELRAWSRLGPLLWWLEHFGGDFSDLLSGFVWEEDRRIVGNITVNRVSPGSLRWLISNVAVARDYRGRGIARALMDAAVAYVEECGGTSVSLQVRANNEPARHIYLSMGFKDISGSTQLRLDRVTPTPELPLPSPLTLRDHRFDGTDARRAYALARLAISARAQEHRPLRQNQFRLGVEDRIGDALRQLAGGGPGRHWVVERNDRDFVAVVDVRPGTWAGEHHVRLVVHPDFWGTLEPPLIGRALNYLARWPRRGATLEHPAEHAAGVEAFKSYGFREIRTHIWMKRDVKQPGD